MKHSLRIILTLCLALSVAFVAMRACANKKQQYIDVAKYGEDISILVDFGEPSSSRRFIVYDNNSQKVIGTSKCAHGSGGGSTWRSLCSQIKPGAIVQASEIIDYEVFRQCITAG